MVSVEDTGLRGVKAATTRISKVDGEGGKLLYRGYYIEDLARESSFEETAYLLMHGVLPTARQLNRFSNELAQNRKLSPAVLRALRDLPLETPPMSVLQAGVTLLSARCPDQGDESREANERKAMRIIAVMPTIVAAWKRRRNGLDPVQPDEDMSQAANFLYMIKDEVPEPDIAKFMDVAMILHADHEFNASTFTTRVVASTGADMYAAVSAGVGALSGPLHGGANAQVMRNLLDTNDPESVEAWVEEMFKRGQRVSGMGHAVYRTIDPRALILQTMARAVLKDHPEYRWYEMTERMAEVTQDIFRRSKGRDIYPNVDLYSASIYHAMGIHHDFFPPVFAMSRSAGWTAHVMEEKFPLPPVKPSLYRPSCTYVGKVGGQYVPIDER
ncbi:citrate/2-methylcitrate synthase [Methanomassiliicoccus luminyensis]|jgi:citrate synthase|uniref:citrate/2-methylcitrate synthase n=1 Tax=Methanomassiliicoccus luminyensis TaxID=1080712 RepID=UPI00035FDD70|nr:citrate/2-methylcitrate synthase [Methanomassiliicoccus luminyensis]